VALADLKLEQTSIEGGIAYDVSGNILNTTEKPHALPDLRVTLVSDTGDALARWEFGGNGKTLEPGQALPFSTGAMQVRSTLATRFVVELGSAMELALRRKPEATP
jgi:hypothetical protein